MNENTVRITGITYLPIGNLQNLPRIGTSVMGDESQGERVFTREDFFGALEKATKPVMPRSKKENDKGPGKES